MMNTAQKGGKTRLCRLMLCKPSEMRLQLQTEGRETLVTKGEREEERPPSQLFKTTLIYLTQHKQHHICACDNNTN